MKTQEDIESKKLEKMIKKEKEDMENLTGPGASNAKMVFDKFNRTLTGLKALTKELNKQRNQHSLVSADIASQKLVIENSLKKKEMLNKISEAFMKQNFDLYLQHE